MNALIVRPFESFRERREPADVAIFPFAILIDGLDECQGDLIPTPGLDNSNTAVKRRAEDRQAELLSAIKNSLLRSHLPFRIFIASRPEWAIHAALGTGGSLHGLAYHIPLSDKYDATEDMRRYLQRRFQDIALRIGQPHWFTEGDIDTLVQAGSGQFVYVATVYKYVSERRASSVQRLKTVLNWTPEQATRPFEALDILYRNILLSAKEAYEAVDTHTAQQAFFDLYTENRADSYDTTTLLGLEPDALKVLALDLRSLVYIHEEEDMCLEYLDAYHKSLYDFMNEKSCAKELFVPIARIRTHLAKCSMRHFLEGVPEDWTFYSSSCRGSGAVAFDCLFNSFTGDADDELVDFTHKGGWDKIDTIVSKRPDIIFGDGEFAHGWAEGVVEDAKGLKKRRPEAGKIMSKYAKKWKNIVKSEFDVGDDGDTTDSSAESNNESSDSDSD